MPRLIGTRRALLSSTAVGRVISPVVSSIFASDLGDYSTLSTTSSMPTGGLITRAGNAMLYDSTGKLTYAPNNLVTYSQDASNGAWTKTNVTVTGSAGTAPDGTTTASLVTPSTSNAAHRTAQLITASAAFIYSAYIKPNGYTKVGFWDYATTGAYAAFDCTGSGSVIDSGAGASSAAITSVGNGWYRISFKATVSGSVGFATQILPPSYTASGGVNTSWAADGTSGVYLWGAQLEAVTYQTSPSTYVATTTSAYYGPRFDVDPVTLQNKGLLVEGTRTNIRTNSNAFDGTTNWFAIGGTLGANSATSPDGTTNAGLFTSTAGSGVHLIYSGNNPTFTSGVVYSFSCYIKVSQGTARYIQFGTGSTLFGANTYANFDLVSGTVGTVGATATSASIQNVGNGYYRIAFVASATGSGVDNAFIDIVGSSSAARQASYTAVATDTFAAYGAQIETGSFPTSYIPTVASSVARAAETFTLANYQNRLVESFYIDEETGGSWSANIAASATSPLTISTPTFGWVTSVRPYTNAYAGDITTPSWIDNSGTTGNRMYYDSTGALTWAPANLLLQSNTLTSTWTNANVTPTIVADAASPDPSGNANQLSASSAANYFKQQFTVRPSTSYIYSFWAKRGTASTLNYRVFDDGNGVDIIAKTNYYSQTNGSTYARIVVAFTTPSNCTLASVYLRADDATGTSFVADCQVEPVTYQTSPRAYIPTTSAAVYQPRYDYDPQSVLQGTGTVSSNTIVFPATFNDGSTCSAVNSYYNGQYVTIGGSNFTITGYVGSTRTATLSSAPAATGSQAFTLGNPTWLTPRGCLIEEGRANLSLYSNDFTQSAWNKAASSVTANSITSPDGTTNASKIQATAGFNAYNLYGTAGSQTSGTAYTYSAFVKYGNAQWLWLRSGDNIWQAFDIQNGVVGNANGAVTRASITPLSNGWYRISMSSVCVTTSANNAVFTIGNGSTPNNGNAITQAGTEYFYLCGFQWETGAFPTSYIPTTTGSVTRVADVVKWTSAAFSSYWNATSGTIINQFIPISSSGSAKGVFSANSGSDANRIDARVDGFVIVTTGAVGQVSMTIGGATAGAANRNAVGYALNNFAAVLNGGTVSTDTSGTVPTVSQFQIGNLDGGTGNSLSGWLQSLAYYNQRLPDVTLKIKSVVGAPY